MHTSMAFVPAGEPCPTIGDMGRLQRPLTTTAGRRDGSMDDLSTRPATGRLVGPDVVRAVAMIGVVVMNFHGYLILARRRRAARLGVRPVRPVGRPALDAVRGDVRARRRRRRDAADPVGDRRRGARPRRCGGDSPAAACSSTCSACASTTSGRARSCRTTARCSCSPPCCSRCGSAGSSSIGVGRRARRRGPCTGGGTSELDGHDTTWLTSPDAGARRAGSLLDVFVNGTHPLLPWLAFFCAGIVLGRLLAQRRGGGAAAIAGGFALFTVATWSNVDRHPRRAHVVLAQPPTRSTAASSTR